MVKDSSTYKQIHPSDTKSTANTKSACVNEMMQIQILSQIWTSLTWFNMVLVIRIEARANF